MIKKIVTITGVCLTLGLTCMLDSSSASIADNQVNLAGMGELLDSLVETQVESQSINEDDMYTAGTVDSISTEDIEDIYDVAAGSTAADVVTAAPSKVPAGDSVSVPMSGAAGILENVTAEPEVTPETPEEVVPEAPEAVDAVDPEATIDPMATPTAEPTPEPVSEYANIGIAIGGDYINIRKRPNTESKIRGKLYRGSAATILETRGDWVKITSGSVKGFIKSEFLAIGFDAENFLDKYGTKIATVKTTTLKVREEKNTECAVLTLVPEGEEFEVVKESGEWVKILVDDTTKGFVSKEFVDINVEFKQAISIKEERAELRRQREREEAARRAEEERRQELARQEAARQQAQSSSSSSKSSSSSSSSSSSHKSSSSSSSSKSSYSSSLGKASSGSSGTGSSAASYAQNFIGNPYSYGGTSLTHGTDCSGFVQSVYSKYGVNLPRTSSSQSSAGSSVDLSNVKPGDLIFYASNGHINHVAMYIGDGKVVHASNKREGIKVSSMNYRTPAKARRVAN